MDHRAGGMNEAGGFVKWDWNKNKYIWVPKNEFNHQKPSHPGQSKYACQGGAGKVAARRPSYKVPGKKACRPPLQAANNRGKVKSPSPKKAAAKPRRVERDFKLPPYDDVRDKENLPHGQQPGHGPSGPSQSGHRLDPPPELHAGHVTILSVMSNRLIHLNAALTFWRQGPNALISYLLRTEDDAATVDALPVLVHCLKNKTAASKQLSMGMCFELLPTLRRLLGSKFEDYLKTSLDVLRTMLRFWWTELLAHREASFSGSLQESRSIAGIYMGAVALTDVIAKLRKRQDSIAKKAEVVGSLLAQL